MRRYFAPSSTLPPPLSLRGQTGNRNVTQTAQNSPNTTPTDNARLTLVANTNGGLVNWRFATTFTKPPTVTATAQTANPNGPQEITVIQVTTVGAIIQSTDPADTRLVHVQALESIN